MAIRRTSSQGTLTTSAVALYTCPTDKRATIAYFALKNYTGTGATATLNVALDGAAAANGNELWNNTAQNIAAEEHYPVDMVGMTIPAGGKLYGLAGTGSTLNWLLTVVEEDV